MYQETRDLKKNLSCMKRKMKLVKRKSHEGRKKDREEEIATQVAKIFKQGNCWVPWEK